MAGAQILRLQEHQLAEWLIHTTECFAWKGTPMSHFENHYRLDPFRKPEDILIASDGQEILSSLRVFAREIYIDGIEVYVGGIGEVVDFVVFCRSLNFNQVCTKESALRKGLCKLLLSEASTVMRSYKARYGFLHCAENLMPVYQSAGYQSSGPRFCRLKIAVDGLDNSRGSFSVHKFNVDNESNTIALLAKIHQSYNKQFNGPVSRSNQDYWKYVNFNIKGAGFYLRRVVGSASEPSCTDAVAAFAALLPSKRQDGFELFDFFVDDIELARDRGAQAFQKLMEHALREYGVHEGAVRLPAPVATSIGLAADTAEDDPGWMWLGLDQCPPPPPDRLVLWAADGF